MNHTTTLTNEQIQRIFLMYVRQPCRFGFEGREKKGQIIGNTEPFGIQVFDPGTPLVPYKNVRPDLIKLLLIPLSAISDEDAIQVAKLTYAMPYPAHTEFEVYENYFGHKVVSWGKGHWQKYAIDLKNNILNAFQNQFLIQRGYAVPLFIDVDHPDNGKTAIQLGIAIDKTQQP